MQYIYPADDDDSSVGEISSDELQAPVDIPTLQKYIDDLISGEQSQSMAPVSKIVGQFSQVLYADSDLDSNQKLESLKKVIKPPGCCSGELKQGDRIWHCQDCAADVSCVLCNSCFEKAAHKHVGHNIYPLSANGGVCDCGDPVSWNPDGFCDDHQGFEASVPAMLESMPNDFNKQSQEFFDWLAKQLKKLLLSIELVQNCSMQQFKMLRHTLVEVQLYTVIIDFLLEQAKELPSNVYFIHKALLMTFEGELDKPFRHVCCFRYNESKANAEVSAEQSSTTPNVLQQSAFEMPEQNSDSLLIGSSDHQMEMSEPELEAQLDKHQQESGNQKCTCSVLDLIFQTSQAMSTETKVKLNELVCNFTQIFNFKESLGLSFIANFDRMSRLDDYEDEGMVTLNTQCLSADKIAYKVLTCEELTQKYLQHFVTLSKESAEDPSSMQKSVNCFMPMVCLAIMAKPSILPVITQKTNVIQGILEALVQFQFCDQTRFQTEHTGYDHWIQHHEQMFYSMKVFQNRLKLFFDKIESKADIDSVIHYFSVALDKIFHLQLDLPAHTGFYIIPVLRLLSYFLKKCYVRNLLPALPETLTAQVIGLLAKQNGFVAEIKAKIWIYRDHLFQNIPNHYINQNFMEYYLSDLGLLQVLLGSQILYKSDDAQKILDQYFKEFGPLELFSSAFSGQQDTAELKRKLKDLNVSPEKFTALLQIFMSRLINICQQEVSLYSNIEIDQKDNSKDLKHILKKELFHNLFLQGGQAIDLNQIKKITPSVYHELNIENEEFINIVKEMTNQQIDELGRVTFKLKTQNASDKARFQQYDPFHYQFDHQVVKQHEAYSFFCKTVQECNNIVGPCKTERHSNSLMAQIQCIVALQFKEIIVTLVKLYLTKDWSDEIEGKLLYCPDDMNFYLQNGMASYDTFKNALKLLVISLNALRNNNNSNLYNQQITFYRESLPQHVLVQQNNNDMDSKLKEILVQISSMIHGQDQEELRNLSQKTEVKTDQKKQPEQLQSKKQSLIAKMKQKQSKFLSKAQPEQVKEQSVGQGEENKTQHEVFTCNLCQESLDDFDNCPYGQPGFLQRSKFLYRSFEQTLKMQKQQLLGNEEQEQKEDESQFAEKIGIACAVDERTFCGSQLIRCPHFFHKKCMDGYRLAQLNSYEGAHARRVVGVDDEMFQCPFCKSISNIFILDKPHKSKLDEDQEEELMNEKQQDTELQLYYISLLSDFINASRIFKKEILRPDIVKNASAFCEQVFKVFTYQLLTITTFKQYAMLQLYDPKIKMNDITLRDLVYILKILKSVLKNVDGLQDQGQRNFLEANIYKFASTPYQSGNVINLLLIQWVLYSSSNNFCYSEDLSRKLKEVIQQCYNGLKIDIGLFQLFKSTNNMTSGVSVQEIQQNWGSEICKMKLNDESSQMQLQFLRAVSCTMQVINSVEKQNTHAQQEDEQQLGLDLKFINEWAQQHSELQEFTFLVNHLDLDPSFQTLTSQIDINNAIGEFIYKAPKQIKLEPQSAFNSIQTIVVPDNLCLLTPFFTINFAAVDDLPSDFFSLTKQYYTRQCKVCQKQLNKNAICLLCGEILCYKPKDNCCANQPGMRQVLLPDGQGGWKQQCEGELSFHARECEGGCSVFLIPSDAKVIMIDDGRIIFGESFYRNQMGETLQYDDNDHQHLKQNRWANFYLDDQCGGRKMLQHLRAMMFRGDLPNYIMQKRLASDTVTCRGIF